VKLLPLCKATGRKTGSTLDVELIDHSALVQYIIVETASPVSNAVRNWLQSSSSS